MRERLLQILDYYKISSAQFADAIGVQRSSISHILSGRNNPSYDFLIKTVEKYAEISADWLLTGIGNMLKSQSSQLNVSQAQNNIQNKDLFTQISSKNENESKPKKSNETKYPTVVDKLPDQEKILSQNTEVTNVNSVKSIIFVYDNNTFEIIQRK